MVLEQGRSEGGVGGRQPRHTVRLALRPGAHKGLIESPRPPAEAEVAVAPGARHLMTVLAGPDVPQTSAAAAAGPPGQPAPQRPL